MSDTYQVHYIVQDIESGEFLCPDPMGGVGFTQYLRQAGHFDYVEDALEAGEDIGGPFQIFTFYLPNGAAKQPAM